MHQLVMEGFTQKPAWAQCVNHINGIKTDNRLVNLEWSTTRDNTIHAFRTGLINNVGENHPQSIPIELVHKVYELKKKGKRQCQIFRELGLTRKKVYTIFNGIDWKYEYKKFFP